MKMIMSATEIANLVVAQIKKDVIIGNITPDVFVKPIMSRGPHVDDPETFEGYEIELILPEGNDEEPEPEEEE
jgi:hypothetical protein